MLRRRVRRLLSFYLQIDSVDSSGAFSPSITLFYAPYVCITHFLTAVAIPQTVSRFESHCILIGGSPTLPIFTACKMFNLSPLQSFYSPPTRAEGKNYCSSYCDSSLPSWRGQEEFTGTFLFYLLSCCCFGTASLTFSSSTFSPHTVFMCFVWISEQTTIISLYNINLLVFITEI